MSPTPLACQHFGVCLATMGWIPERLVPHGSLPSSCRSHPVPEKSCAKRFVSSLQPHRRHQGPPQNIPLANSRQPAAAFRNRKRRQFNRTTIVCVPSTFHGSILARDRQSPCGLNCGFWPHRAMSSSRTGHLARTLTTVEEKQPTSCRGKRRRQLRMPRMGGLHGRPMGRRSSWCGGDRTGPCSRGRHQKIPLLMSRLVVGAPRLCVSVSLSSVVGTEHAC